MSETDTRPLHERLAMHQMRIAHAAAMGVAYAKNWEADFARNEIRDALAHKSRPTITAADFQNMTDDERRSLGFGLWSGEAPPLWLIPLWAWWCIADGETLTSIDGETAVKGRDGIDLDQRFGCIAWGFALSA